MPTKAQRAKGIEYFIDDGSGTRQKIAEILNITPPNPVADDIEVTNHDSPLNGREYIAGLVEFGEVTFSVNWVPGDTDDNILEALRLSGETRTNVIRWPNGFEWTFDGYIKGMTPGTEIASQMTTEVTVKVASSYTRAQGS